jgi:hypothetical protein
MFQSNTEELPFALNWHPLPPGEGGIEGIG